MSGKLQDKVSIITGATSGIGVGIVKKFVEEGAIVYFCGRREEKGKAVEEMIHEMGGEATFIKADITVEADMANLIQTVIDKHGRIDVFVPNAGIGPTIQFMDMTNEDFEKCIQSDCLAHIRNIRMVLPHMIKAGKGAIVATTSLAAKRHAPMVTAYCTAKAGLTEFLRTLVNEVGPLGIRVNVVAPGYIYSELIPKTEQNDAIGGMMPLRRVGFPEEVGAVHAFLASDEASYVTGAYVPVDGGMDCM